VAARLSSGTSVAGTSVLSRQRRSAVRRGIVAADGTEHRRTPTLSGVMRRLKRAVKLVLETLPIVPACRLLAGRRLARIPIAFCIDIEPDTRKDGPGAVP